jgi:hypothetical protein
MHSHHSFAQATSLAHLCRTIKTPSKLTMCEGHGACGDDLQHLEHLLRARVKLLRACVHVLQALVAVNVCVDVVAEAAEGSVPASSDKVGTLLRKVREMAASSWWPSMSA